MRRTPQASEGEEEKYINEQLVSGAIQLSISEWASPVVMVRKKTGDECVCIDYRKLNERTVKDAYPLPRIYMCLDCLASAKTFSTIIFKVPTCSWSWLKKTDIRQNFLQNMDI